jgi:hypothetical protein
MNDSPSHYSRKQTFWFAAVTALFYITCTALSAEGGISQFANRIAWQASAGHAVLSEDFNSFAVDTPFRIADGSLALNGFTLVETGPETKSLNLVDLPPLINATNDVNGTPFASIATDFAETSVELRFAKSAHAFGADFQGANGPEQLNIDLFRPDGSLLATIDPSIDTGFIGFVSTDGETVSYLRFRATIDQGPNIREAFGIDNIQLISVPEPTTYMVSLCASAAIHYLFGRTRRKRRNE